MSGTRRKRHVRFTDGAGFTRHCWECANATDWDREDGLCYRDPNHCGCYRPAHDDGFCAWAEKKEDVDG